MNERKRRNRRKGRRWREEDGERWEIFVLCERAKGKEGGCKGGRERRRTRHLPSPVHTGVFIEIRNVQYIYSLYGIGKYYRRPITTQLLLLSHSASQTPDRVSKSLGKSFMCVILMVGVHSHYVCRVLLPLPALTFTV